MNYFVEKWHFSHLLYVIYISMVGFHPPKRALLINFSCTNFFDYTFYSQWFSVMCNFIWHTFNSIWSKTKLTQPSTSGNISSRIPDFDTFSRLMDQQSPQMWFCVIQNTCWEFLNHVRCIIYNISYIYNISWIMCQPTM